MKPLALRSILVATDLGADDVPALQSAHSLAALCDAELNVLHALEAPSDAKGIEERLGQVMSQVGTDLGLNVLTGPAGAIIPQEARRTGADVIVLGRHRNRAGFPGSTADRVVRRADVPCLILPRRLRLPLGSVLAPLDLNDAAPGNLAVALTWASALRRRRGNDPPTRIDVIHVPHGSMDAADAGARLHAQVGDVLRRVAPFAGVAVEERVVANETGTVDAILNHVEAEDSDLVVLGTRRERMSRDPLGSVSSAVVSRATHPVLLAPPQVLGAR